MKAKDENTFCIKTPTGHIAGAFNVYQAKSGAVILILGASVIELTREQCKNLKFSLYELGDFDNDNYKMYYNF